MNEGLNASERYLTGLCRNTFLSLWSFPNVFRQPGSELCDLLVVCGDDIIIFSDKACHYPTAQNPNLNWARWFNRAVSKSAKQLWGAEKWIKRDPARVFRDSTCQQPLRAPIIITSETRFHLVLVAHGASVECVEKYGGSGSLMIDTRIQGLHNHIEPFILGDLDASQTFIHILDDHSLDVLLTTRDTINDFTDYLTKRERLLRSPKRVFAAGEEEMLAYFLKCLNDNNEHDFIVPESETEGYAFAEGTWNDFIDNGQRQRQIAADEISYLWDNLTENFCFHTINNSQYYVSESGYNDGEKAIRCLAQENRFTRRVLAESLLNMLSITPKHLKRIRVMPTFRDHIYYVVLLLPFNAKMYEGDYDQYRTFRRFYLECTVYVVRLLYTDAKHVVGIAMESGIQPTASSEDLIYFDCSGWNEELERQTKIDQQELQILLSPKEFQVDVKEYPD